MDDLIADTNLLFMRAITEGWPLKRLQWRLIALHLRYVVRHG